MIPIETMSEIREQTIKLKKMKTNKLLKRLAVMILFITLMFYIAGSVTSASFDIKQWDQVTRGTVAIFWIMAVFAGTGFISDIK